MLEPVMFLTAFTLLIALTVLVLFQVPGGFIPQQDQGYIIVAVELPKGASLDRTDKVIKQATELIKATPGAFQVVAFAGFSGATFSNASNAGAIFVTLKPFDQRGSQEMSSKLVIDVSAALSQIQEAQFFVLEPPPVRGVGNAGGFKMMLQDRSGRGLRALDAATIEFVAAAVVQPEWDQTSKRYFTSTSA